MKPKLGLALSGGGFRASLFHIGVLARLAELGILPLVEVLSTVSGGSIVGAQYYLLLKNLLESNRNSRIGRTAFVDLIAELESTFLKAIQSNLRTRAYADIAANIRMIGSRRFTRSDRMADLYDEYLYAPASGRKRISMRELKIKPLGWEGPFNPKLDNHRLKYKVPALIINATTLNTGRNWQFSAVEAGEYDQPGGEQYNKNILCTPFRYETDDNPNPDIPEKYPDIPLSVAVAASACVPGVFVPLPLTDLYNGFVPKLVDGGVYDNQGLYSLIHAGCTHIFVSDASGQMDDQARPGSGILSVLMRSNSVLTDRTRDAGFDHLAALLHARKIDSTSIHLRSDFPVPILAPKQTPPPWNETVPVKTEYGIRGDVQYWLSNIRTDLDSFTTVEAHALMYSGYAMTSKYFPSGWFKSFKGAKRSKGSPWKFRSIEPFVQGQSASKKFEDILKAGKALVFKAFRLVPGLGFAGIALALLALILLGCAAARLGFDNAVRILGLLAFGLLAHGVLSILPRQIKFLYRIDETVLRISAGLTAMVFGWLFARLHLLLIEPLYLKYGQDPK